MTKGYVHGYSPREAERLLDQAQMLTKLLHHDTRYPKGSKVLEAGCGIGAQTIPLAQHSPDADITSIDLSPVSLAQAEERVRVAGIRNVTFRQADIHALPFADNSFDHVFVCFVLEHLPDPARALAYLRRVLRPGGSITVIEGDHGSAYFSPDSAQAKRTIECLVEIQRQMGGDALIGRRCYPLLAGAGFKNVTVSPRMVYVDASRPALVEGFTKQTFTAMVEGIGPEVMKNGLMNHDAWERGVSALYRTAEPDGVFCYTFFKATARK